MTDPRGVLFALVAYVVWGFAPLFWHQVHGVAAGELLAQRTVWSCVAFGALLAALGRWRGTLAILGNRRAILTLACSGALIAINWFVYLYSVLTAQLVESSLGYFINPIVNVGLGMLVLGERLSRARTLAVLLAAAGVVLLALRVQGVPWIALSLAFSFGTYGLLRKTLQLDALQASNLEMLGIAPFALAYLIWLAVRDPAHALHHDVATWAWLVASGPFTALPLLSFALAARRLPLSTLGFFQYVSPTLQLALAVLLYGEPFTALHARAFGLIWVALALYSIDLRRGKTPHEA
jgi:chloramphenicol-sensitive protein RarD